jgi:hypothetical protein
MSSTYWYSAESERIVSNNFSGAPKSAWGAPRSFCQRPGCAPSHSWLGENCLAFSSSLFLVSIGIAGSKLYKLVTTR